MGLSQDIVDALTQLAVCSTVELTIFFTPFQQALPSYICTIKNLTYLDSPESNAFITDLVHSTITVHPNVTSFIHSSLPEPDAEAVIKALQVFCVSSLNIPISPGDLHTVWNVYCDNPVWFNLIRDLHFNSLDYGVDITCQFDNQFFCLNCKSYNHPSGLCPLPHLVGWLSPSTSVKEDTDIYTTPKSLPTQNKNNAGCNPRTPTWGRHGRGRN